MKKIYFHFLFIICLFISLGGLKAQTFNVGAPGSDYTLTCENSVITMTTNSGTTPYSYTWTAPSSTLYGNYANISVPGTWTVTGQDLNTLLTSQQTFTIFQNLQTPSIVVSPTIANITCTGSSVCFTLTSNLGPNVTTNWFMVQASNTVYVGFSQGTINIYCPGQPGVYWGESVNNLTGCKATKSVQVTASVGVPIFTVTSPSNFSLGCSSTSCTSMQVTNVITSPTPSATVQYTYVPPATSGTPTTFTANPNLNSVCIPGTWVVYVKDVTNNCISSQSISVIQNTIPPNVYHMQPFTPLTCSNSSMVLTGMSNNLNTTVTWTVPITNVVVSGQTIQVNTNPSIPNSSVALTSLGSYSLGIVDNNNQCGSIYTLQIIQDIRKPVFTISAFTNSIITCSNQSVTIVPVMTLTLAVALVPTYTWFPPPSGPGFPGTQYNSSTPGTHTANCMSAVNGCTNSATYNVAADSNVLTAISSTQGANCPFTGNVILFPALGSNSTNLTYSWSPPAGALTSALTGASLSTNMLGNYTVAITNSLTGCSTTVVVSLACANGIKNQNLSSSDVKVYPNPSKGILTIELSAVVQNAKMSIYDLQGKLVIETTLNSKVNKLDIELPKGCYLYRISNDNAILKREKLIIE